LTAALANAASASAPPALFNATAEAATLLATASHAGLIPSKLILLTEGVMKSMLFSKLKLAAGAVIVVGAVAFTVMGFSNRSVQADPPAAIDLDEPAEPPKPVSPAPKSPKDTPPLSKLLLDDPAPSEITREVRGTITGVEGALATTTLGKDHGVNAGSILEVFRLQP